MSERIHKRKARGTSGGYKGTRTTPKLILQEYVLSRFAR